MKWQFRILFNEEGGAGGGGTGGAGGAGTGAGGSTEVKKEHSESDWTEIQTQRDELKGKVNTLQSGYDELKAKLDKIESDKLIAEGKTGDLLVQKETELTTTKTKLTDLETQLAAEKEKSEKINKKIKKDLLDKLPEDHKKLVEKSDDLEFIADYVKINGIDKQVIEGSHTATPLNEIAALSWNEMTMEQKKTLKASNPALYQKKLETRNNKT